MALERRPGAMEKRASPVGASVLSDNTLLACIFGHLDNAADRRAVSQVCRQWKRVDSHCRKFVKIPNCYSVVPAMLSKRFPNLHSLKIRGMPRASEYGLLPYNWGAYAAPWVKEVAKSYSKKLQSLWLARMHVNDDDLTLLALSCSDSLVSLKLHKCFGFSTAGLAAISSRCRLLKKLFLEECDVAEPPASEASAAGAWLNNLAVNSRDLEELNFQYTSMKTDSINVSDLELLVENCRELKSLKLDGIDILDMAGLFRNKDTMLAELGTGTWRNVADPQTSPPIVTLPTSIIGLSGLYELTDACVPMISSILGSLKKLDFLYAFLTPEGHQAVLRHCCNLEELKANSGIGDQGLITVAESCKNLRRLRVDRLPDSDTISPHGIIPLAQNCVKLEFLVLYVTVLDNAALAAVGENCKVLKDVRFVTESFVTESVIDDGVKALLQGCRTVTRFALYGRRGALSDTGMAYIGQYGANLKWVLLGAAGESDAGLLSLARGCHSLEKLEMRDCPVTEKGLADAARLLSNSLKFMWVQGCHATESGGRLLASCRPHWIVEVQSGEHVEPGLESFTAYCSLAGPRTDHPPEISVLSSGDGNGPLPGPSLNENGGP